MDFSKQRRERERQDDKMLHEYRQQQDFIALAKELTARSNDRAYSRRIASLNLEMASTQQVCSTQYIVCLILYVFGFTGGEIG